MSIIINEEKINEIKALLDNNFDDVKNFINAYINDSKRLIAKILICFKCEDYIVLSRHAHTLKSSSFQFGAYYVATYAENIVLVIKEKNFLSLDDLIEQLQRSFSEAQQELERYSLAG